MFEISKEFTFSAGHHLKGLEEGHPCARPHGHNYRVRVTLRAEAVDRVGFVRDYGELSLLKKYLDSHFDHRILNTQISFNPTAELLAVHLYTYCKQFWPETYKVEVSETDKTWAAYYEE